MFIYVLGLRGHVWVLPMVYYYNGNINTHTDDAERHPGEIHIFLMYLMLSPAAGVCCSHMESFFYRGPLIGNLLLRTPTYSCALECALNRTLNRTVSTQERGGSARADARAKRARGLCMCGGGAGGTVKAQTRSSPFPEPFSRQETPFSTGISFLESSWPQ